MKKLCLMSFIFFLITPLLFAKNQDQPKKEKVRIMIHDQKDFEEDAFKYLILYLNKIQNIYEFEFIDSSNINKYLMDAKSCPEEMLLDEYNKSVITIVIVSSHLKNDYIFYSCFKTAIMTTHDWNKKYSPPTVYEYLINSILSFAVIVKNDELNYHEETRGCLLDQSSDKADTKINILTNYICDDCKKIILKNSGKAFYESLVKVLNRSWLGNVNTPNTPAYHLKEFYKVDLFKDSGLKKSFFEQIHENAFSVFTMILSCILGIISTLVTQRIIHSKKKES